jgi:hypothetical protein
MALRGLVPAQPGPLGLRTFTKFDVRHGSKPWTLHATPPNTLLRENSVDILPVQEAS